MPKYLAFEISSMNGGEQGGDQWVSSHQKKHFFQPIWCKILFCSFDDMDAYREKCTVADEVKRVFFGPTHFHWEKRAELKNTYDNIQIAYNNEKDELQM